MKVYKLLLILLCFSSNDTFAGTPRFTWKSEKALSVGYRNDSLSTTLKSVDSIDSLTSDLDASNIRILDVGMHGTVRFCNTWLIQGLIEFGWVNDGRFKELDGPDPIQASKGVIDEGYTRDYSMGIGYSYSFCNNLKFEPVIGYSYNAQEIQMCHIKTNGSYDSILSDLRYHMRWDGPWIGFQSQFQLTDLTMTLGYQYHRCRWKAKWLLEGGNVEGVAFSDERRSSDAWGHLAFFDTFYKIYKCWNLGLAFIYRYREAPNGSLIPITGSFSENGFPDIEKVKINKATWSSYQININLYYNF